MGLEIERKFLIVGTAWRSQICRSQAMRQGYLVDTGGRASIRVRVDGSAAQLNIKAAVIGCQRAEYEYGIPINDAEQILTDLCVGQIEKTRHYIEQGDLTWEIDEFHGNNEGLIVAEIELHDSQQKFAKPPWLGEEVTQEQRYYNHALAIKPYRSWDHAS